MYFNEDLFSLLGHSRPPYRWVLLGAKGSGSCFHQDPNYTAAWNASLTGRKKFVLFPGNVVPPGVTTLDEDNFVPPLSVIQWFVEYYPFLEKGTFVECVVHPGEMIFVPSGWWHTVLNLDCTIAVTQNFVDHVNCPDVMSYLKFHKPSIHDSFLRKLEECDPHLLLSVKKKCSQEEKSDWDRLVEGEEGENFVLDL
eukprot:TRINITY_DN1641_c0_g1_i10.p1 TRINITY_DN1641_c0_g1~~TRINITY_DN1641_c0_g1_i10.p1  ORF type:complete len:196 (+),score=46.98 TRINITY_DN1641_c0_g1_i10:1215-1802(+)